MRGSRHSAQWVTRQTVVWAFEPPPGSAVLRIAVERAEHAAWALMVDDVVVERYAALEIAVSIAGFLERDLKRAKRAKAIALKSVA